MRPLWVGRRCKTAYSIIPRETLWARRSMMLGPLEPFDLPDGAARGGAKMVGSEDLYV